MKYIYGPVNSRRLGRSLGISLTPHKLCDFDCIYCQLGKAREKTGTRKAYIKAEDIISELSDWLKANPSEQKNLDYITLSGSGEPTINSEIGLLLRRIKEMVPVPLAVITNASLVSDPQVRRELLAADLIVPSLDAADEEVFQAIDRPAAGIDFSGIIEGLVALGKEFKGQIWLEVMLVKGVNDSLEHSRRLKEIIFRIKPDKVQLNSPVRATAEPGVLPVDKKRLEEIRELLGAGCSIA